MDDIPCIIRPLFAALCIALCAGFLPAQSLPAWAAGEWRVSKPSAFFLGEKVSFKTGAFTLFYNVAGDPSYPFQIETTTCSEPLYETDWEDEEAFFATNQAHFEELTGLRTDSIPVLRLYCIDPKMGAQVYFVKKNRLLITYLGMTAHLKPKKKCWFF